MCKDEDLTVWTQDCRFLEKSLSCFQNNLYRRLHVGATPILSKRCLMWVLTPVLSC